MKVACDYCRKPAKLVTGKIVYPHRKDLLHKFFWYCKDCGAWVGTHKNSKDKAPLGRLANKELRQAKMAAHAVFDPIWKSGRMSRPSAYAWLAEATGISKPNCHIGMMDVDGCKSVIVACRLMGTI